MGEPKIDDGGGKEPVLDLGSEAKVLCKFMPLTEDITWASKSIIAKLKNGCCLSVVQQSFFDAGFVDFRLVSLGGDNMLLHPGVEGDVMVLFNEAADLIGIFLDDYRPW